MRCLQLAKNGLGSTYPNPMVGSVIVHNNIILGEGWHRKAGKPHAEVIALRSVKNKKLLKDATLYVNLEPCSHVGKTPPCADLIISEGIKKVVVGGTDPNPEVAGNGIKKLKNAGCEVITGVLEAECLELNKRFYTYHRKKRPYIFLKWAQTADGFIAPDPKTRKDRAPVWITSDFSRQLVHKIRSEEMAILTGTQTVLEDNPSLTTRDWAGKSPVRLIIDKKLQTPLHFSVLDNSVPTILFSEKTDITLQNRENIEIINPDFSKNTCRQIVNFLYTRQIQSLIVEGGSRTLQTFIDAGLWDEALIFTGKSNFFTGIKAPQIQGVFIAEDKIGPDSLWYYKNKFCE